MATHTLRQLSSTANLLGRRSHVKRCQIKPQAISAPRDGKSALNAFTELKSLPYSPRNGQDAPKCVAAAIELLENEVDTVLSIQVPDYPGLLRVISWVLNGMDLRVKAASLQTTSDGMALDVLTITNMSGDKLSSKQADSMIERLQDFVMYCSPSPKLKNPEKMGIDGVEVCHKSHEKFTVITIAEQLGGKQGFLLDVASMLSGVGLNVMEAEIKSGDTDAGNHRMFTFLVCDEHGHKLSTATSGTVIYILSLLMGKGHAPLVVPSASGYLIGNDN